MSRVQSSSSNSKVTVLGPIDVEQTGFDALTNPPSQLAVGLTTTLVFADNPNRKYAHIMNNSGLPIYIQYGAPAVPNQGIVVPNSTLYTIETTNLWLGIVNAVGVTAGQLIDILEGE